MSRWRPVLEGKLRDEALAAAGEILQALPDPEEVSPSPSLASGDAGFAVAAAYAAETLGDGYRGPAGAFLSRAVENAASGGLSLYDGVAGVGWAAEHLRALLGGPDPNEELDEALASLLTEGWKRDHDLVSGLVGFGVYALERLPGEGGHRILDLVVRRLAERARRDEDGASWVSRAEWVPAEFRHLHPEESVNLGLAHGTPGVVALLGAARRARVDEVGLLEDAVAWILRHEISDASSCFPTWIAPGEEPAPARTAWCYGDPGVAASLLAAARGAGRRDWEEGAVRIARAAATRPAELTRAEDPGLCHGATGLAHLFNRMFQETSDPAFGAAATEWVERALEMRETGEGIAGFRSLRPDADRKLAWTDDPTLLTGAAGIALALLGAATDVEPAWDRFLLLSSPISDRAGSSSAART